MTVRELAPAQAWERVLAGARLVDVRSPAEQSLGMAARAQAIALDDLVEAASREFTNPAEPIVLICQRGLRSRMAAALLGERGFIELASVEGGIERWQADGLPMQFPEDTLFLERYSRQIRLPQMGLDGQRRLRDATVLVLGAGGLGSPAAFYLAAAGIGNLRIVDDDVVDRSNLQRQILHVDAGIGESKVESARTRLAALNPDIRIDIHAVRVDASNVDALLADVDVVLDGGDNFPVRHVLNDACLRLCKPLVYGAVQRFEGQVSVFDAGRQRGVAPCYRCLFPEAPTDMPNCSEAGVLGVVPGVIGLLQATEVIKLILDIGESLIGRLLMFDALAMQFREIRVPVDPGCPACGGSVQKTGD